jgi:hypothetical protein
MPGEDDKLAFDVIKDSMGLTDEELSPQGDLDWGDDSDISEQSGGESDDEPLSGEPDDSSFDSHEQQREQPVRRDQDNQQREQRQQQDPLRQNTLRFDPRATFRQDKKGNLIDTRTGEIIARAGSEARIYQRVHKQASDYIKAATGNIQNAINTERSKVQRAVEIGLGFEKELSELKQTFNRINAHELQTDQLLEAAQYYKQAQTDPVGVLKNLLTRAALSGIDVTQLGMDGNQFDPKTLIEMVRKEVQAGIAPVQQYTSQRMEERESQNVESQYLRQAEGQVQQFFGSTPEAIPYTHIFHAVLSQPQFQHMSLGEIWDKVQLHLMRNGVDPRSAPTRSQRQRLNGNPGLNGQRPPSRSLPSGQGMTPQGSDGNGRSPTGPAHPSMSYDAIIREVLGKAR